MINQYIRDYGKRLYGLCTFLCANSCEADDLYQETWLKVVKNIDKYDTTKEFEPWLTAICVNTYRNTLRRILKSPVFNTFATTEEKELVINSVPHRKKKIYNFEAKEPPILNESKLRAEIEKRRLSRQTTIAAIAGILIQIVLLLCAELLAKEYIILSILCVAYVILSATGGTVIAILINSSVGKRALRQA